MNKTNNTIQTILCGIWCLLICFAVIWFVEPQWLKDISSHGRIVESTENKLKGDELLRQSNFPEAYKAYDDALNINSSMQSAAIGKAIAAEKLNKDNEALKILTDLLKNNPDKPWEIYYNLSIIYEKKRDKQKTINALEKCIDTSPDPFSASLRLARLYFTSSEWDNALKLYNQTLSFIPDMKNDYITSLKTEKEIYKLDDDVSNSIESFINKGWNNEIKEQYYEYPYVKSLKSNPSLARIYNDIGFCYAMKKDIPASLPYFQKAVKIQPQSKEYNQNLAKANHELSQ